jgi:uncharacterized protein
MALENKLRLSLALLAERFAVCRLPASIPAPHWALEPHTFSSICRTDRELSILCPQSAVPELDLPMERDWMALRVFGPLSFSDIGVLASIAEPLAAGGISIMCVSTFDTDYFFVKADEHRRAVEILEASGHAVDRQ